MSAAHRVRTVYFIGTIFFEKDLDPIFSTTSADQAFVECFGASHSYIWAQETGNYKHLVSPVSPILLYIF